MNYKISTNRPKEMHQCHTQSQPTAKRERRPECFSGALRKRSGMKDRGGIKSGMISSPFDPIPLHPRKSQGSRRWLAAPSAAYSGRGKDNSQWPSSHTTIGLPSDSSGSPGTYTTLGPTRALFDCAGRPKRVSGSPLNPGVGSWKNIARSAMSQ